MQNTPENHNGFIPIKNSEDFQRKSFENNYDKRQELHFNKPPLHNAANTQETKRFGSVGQTPWAGYDVNHFEIISNILDEF